MAKFKVKVTVTAQCEYEVEVEAATESDAEDRAHENWRAMLPEDFQVEKGYITDWDTEAEQLTWECVVCDKEISEADYRKFDEMCESCEAADRARTGG
jgi:hypothetical protein